MSPPPPTPMAYADGIRRWHTPMAQNFGGDVYRYSLLAGSLAIHAFVRSA